MTRTPEACTGWSTATSWPLSEKGEQFCCLVSLPGLFSRGKGACHCAGATGSQKHRRPRETEMLTSHWHSQQLKQYIWAGNSN